MLEVDVGNDVVVGDGAAGVDVVLSHPTVGAATAEAGESAEGGSHTPALRPAHPAHWDQEHGVSETI